MPTVPSWFKTELEAFDPDLRLRWSRRTETWHLERKVTRSLHPGTIRNDHWHDDYIRAADGYVLVATIPPHGLSRVVFQRLRDSDLWANGGWEKVARDIEEWEEADEEQKWAKFSEKIRDDSADLYEHLKIRDGRTIYSPGWVE